MRSGRSSRAPLMLEGRTPSSCSTFGSKNDGAFLHQFGDAGARRGGQGVYHGGARRPRGGGKGGRAQGKCAAVNNVAGRRSRTPSAPSMRGVGV